MASHQWQCRWGPLFCLWGLGQMLDSYETTRGENKEEGKKEARSKSNRYLSLMDGGENAVLITAICPGYLYKQLTWTQLSTQLDKFYTTV